MNKKNKLKILLCVIIISSIIGFIYEEIFYYIDLGYFVKRGSGFGPWIPIYGIGGLLVVLLTNKFKNNKILTVLLCTLIPALLELTIGYCLHHFFNIRLWNYNKEILNFGNINGYVCLRSILLFSLGELMLIYKIVPYLEKKISKLSYKKSYIIYIISFIYFFDIIFNYIIKENWR